MAIATDLLLDGIEIDLLFGRLALREIPVVIVNVL